MRDVGDALLRVGDGSAVCPGSVRPPVAARNAYKGIEGWKMAEPRADLLRGPWWEMFGDTELNRLEEQVDISNQNVAAAEAQFREALALVREARAAYFPTVSIGVGVTRSRTSGGSGNRTIGNGTTVNDYSLPINASWEPDVWGRIRRTVESQQATAQASAADLEAARLSSCAILAQDYFLLRAQDAQQQLLTATVADFEKSLQLTRNQSEAGTVSAADVVQAETTLEATRRAA